MYSTSNPQCDGQLAKFFGSFCELPPYSSASSAVLLHNQFVMFWDYLLWLWSPLKKVLACAFVVKEVCSMTSF